MIDHNELMERFINSQEKCINFMTEKGTVVEERAT